MRGIDKVMQEETHIKVFVAPDPLDCVAIGTGKALESLDQLRPGAVYINSFFS